MAKTPSSRASEPRCANRLLAALPENVYQRLAPSVRIEPLTFKRVLHKHGAKIETVYFPLAGVCSVTTVMNDGRMVEVANIGNEGMVGMSAVWGSTMAIGETFVQVPGGDSLALPISVFSKEVERGGALREMLGRYTQALQSLVMQSSACNALHSVEQRAARWLLMTHDRAGSDTFQLTHEFLGYMLGVRRPTVSLVLGALNKAGVIQTTMKHLRIVDRPRLEAISCECYPIVQAAFARVVPAPSGRD